jgi:hypothetical protein
VRGHKSWTSMLELSLCGLGGGEGRSQERVKNGNPVTTSPTYVGGGNKTVKERGGEIRIAVG